MSSTARLGRWLVLAVLTLSSVACVTMKNGMAIHEHQSWLRGLGGEVTPRVAIERSLQEIQLAAKDARPDWKPIIDYAAQAVEITFYVPLDTAKPKDRRVYEASIQLVVVDLSDDSVTITPRILVSIFEVRQGIVWGTSDSQELGLTYEIQQILSSIERIGTP